MHRSERAALWLDDKSIMHSKMPPLSCCPWSPHRCGASSCGARTTRSVRGRIISGNRVAISSRGVGKAHGIRYVWADWPIGCNLYNTAGLPLVPFTQ